MRVGSSPLARGTHYLAGWSAAGGRLIPARAGNTRSVWVSGRWVSAHPRSRGEHSPLKSLMSSSFGSSPLARGTHGFAIVGTANQRLIPARAGNTNSIPRVCYAATAHPRSRGEHGKGLRSGHNKSGSSPLARGTRNQGVAKGISARLIPARAGNTRAAPGALMPAAAPPRSRGEHFFTAFSKARRAGSSPLARGTPTQHLYNIAGERLIPARAGNTPGRS